MSKKSALEKVGHLQHVSPFQGSHLYVRWEGGLGWGCSSDAEVMSQSPVHDASI